MSNFENQTKLLLEVISTVVQPPYALKGGTAINFFYSNMPRLSIDIDLTYSKINNREEFLIENQNFFEKLSTELPQKYGVSIQILTTLDKIPKQLIIASNEAQIKVDVNLVLRGTVYPAVLRNSCEYIGNKYGMRLQITNLSFEDIYAGKFCAALDRQHPRDLFDVMMFFRHHHITEKLKKAFIVYLISSNRPISELINPNRLDQRQLFQTEFQGMTEFQIAYKELENAREQLIYELQKVMIPEAKAFLMSFKSGDPQWNYFGMDHIREMPGIKWKLHNIKRMDHSKHLKSLNELERKLAAD